MRLWSIHPSYLDDKGLLALWRESLLAQRVLLGKTKGYKNHPQLIRFKQSDDPVLYINYYLQFIYDESLNRGFKFNSSKFSRQNPRSKLPINKEQIQYEMKLLLAKLKERNIKQYNFVKQQSSIAPHPIFYLRPGEIENWEKVKS